MPKKIDRPELPGDIGIEQFAELIGMSQRGAEALVEREVIQRTQRGMVDLRAAMKAYSAHMREKAGGRKDETPSVLTDERARLARANADAAELKNAITRKNYIPAADAERLWSDTLRKIKSSIMSVPSRLRQQLPAMTAAESQIIDRELRESLRELGGG